MRTLVLLSLLGACTPSNESEDTSLAGDSNSSEDSGEPGDTANSGESGSPDIPEGTNGTLPEVALEAPEFAATNRDGGARDREDLLGHPTIMWFYPAAGTYG